MTEASQGLTSIIVIDEVGNFKTTPSPHAHY